MDVRGSANALKNETLNTDSCVRYVYGTLNNGFVHVNICRGQTIEQEQGKKDSTGRALALQNSNLLNERDKRVY